MGASDDTKVKQLSADQAAKLAQLLAPVAPAKDSLWKVLGARLVEERSSLTDAGKASVQAAFPEGDGPAFDDKDRLLEALKPPKKRDDRDRDRDSARDRGREDDRERDRGREDDRGGRGRE